MKAIGLRTEFLKNPVGMDILHPRLFWNCEGGKKQTGYRIVATTEDKTVWDSGKVMSERMRAEYPAELVSRQRVEWKVQLWDEKEEAGDWSEEASFEMRLLTAEQEEFAKKRLIRALENYDWRLGTGFLSTPFILYVLADIDIEYAYRLLENEKLPGWLCMPKMGANTVWENWEGPHARAVASLNHYSKGAVCEWIFSQMCGVSVAGENRFLIAPKPGGNLTHARTEYASVYGKVSCGWNRTQDGCKYRVSVPVNCTAEIVLSDGRKQTVGAGDYQF